MFVPGLTATGWPLIHSFTTKGGAGSPIRPPNPILGARHVIRTTRETAYFIIIPYEFIHARGLAQVPNFCPPKQGRIPVFSNVGNLGNRSADILVGFDAFVNPRPTRM